jgi:hypothetical protein
MKMQSNRLLTPLSQEGVTNLTKEVKETLATEYKKNQEQVLSTADLWNIHRQRKVRLVRRFI